ncbi:MAG: hypothetical protein LUF92_03895 [Clostridiales bacterium]|nr:hypothetical protein [Clostridiales bacterium]
MKEYEYLLAMQTKLWKKQYGDFIKDLTPIFFSLSEKVLKQCGGLCFKDIGNQDKKGVWKLNKAKLINLKIHTKYDLKDRSFISSLNILEILDTLCINQEVMSLMHKIRDVEEEVRNLAAHQIVGVTDAWIKRKTKLEPEEIMDLLFQLAECAGLHISKRNRDIYNQMNKELIDKL